MRIFLIFLLSILFNQFFFSQNADELNIKSRDLIQKGKYEEAFPILKQAATLGSGEAQYNLGYALQNGVGTEKNIPEAIQWYKKSSDSNFNDGHYAMMMVYGNGEGIEQDSEKAFNYALRCSENNDSTCMLNVVFCYLTGSGVEKNIEEFKIWTVKLAKLQNSDNLIQSANITSARLQLAQFYREGLHFEKDLYQSYLWYLIYNEFKKDFSFLQQDQIIKEIKDLEKNLSNDQIKNSKNDAANLLGRILNNSGELYKNSL